MNGHIMLSNGEYFDLMNPDMDLVTVEVIADALSKLCRFTGHSKRFYSVAEHCVLVSHLLSPEGDGHAGLELEGLLHDASETFVGDMATPLKNIQPAYKEIEVLIERALQVKFFGSEWGPYTEGLVKKADLMALAYEVRDLMPGGDDPQYWVDMPTPAGPPPWRLGLGPGSARYIFLKRYTELTEGR